MKETDMKHALATATCAAALVASLTACGGADEKSGLPTYTGESTPTSTSTTKSAKATPTATATKTGPVALAPHSTNTYGGLKVVVNLPADIPAASRPSMRVLSDFFQALARTTARNKPDPALTGLATANVVKYVHTFVEAGSVQGAGSVTFTVKRVQTGTSGFGIITGCLDQSRLVQVRKDGSQFVDANTKKYPTLELKAETNPGAGGPTVSLFTYAPGTC